MISYGENNFQTNSAQQTALAHRTSAVATILRKPFF
jgi:hypothetical protein